MIQDNQMYACELSVAVDIALEAGAVIRDFYEQSSASTYTKGDGSPVTDADLASDRIIRERLGAAFPADAILTEEGADDTARLTNDRCWIVDPIDGTKQFINRTGEFDVLITLAVEGRPAVAVLYQPTEDRALLASAGGGAWIQRGGRRKCVQLRPVEPGRQPRLFTSSYFGAPASLPLLARVATRAGTVPAVVSPYGVTTRYLLPEMNRFDAMIGIDVPFTGRMAWEWDFAASDLFVHEAGGRFTDLWGHPLTYNKPIPRNVGGFLMSVDGATHARILEAVAPELGEVLPVPE